MKPLFWLTNKGREHRPRWIAALLLSILFVVSAAEAGTAAERGEFPAVYQTTTRLNVRESDSAGSRRLGTLGKGEMVRVEWITDSGWAMIRYNSREAYISADYITYFQPVETPAKQARHRRITAGGVIGWAFKILIAVVIIKLLQKVSVFVMYFMSVIMYKLYWLVNIPFYLLNWIQRFLAKPWRDIYRRNKGGDRRNRRRRMIWDIAKVPFYIILTPLRLINAIYYNLIAHCSFELYNYLLEVVLPSNPKEGADNDVLLIALIPWRFLRYVILHGSLTLIESVIWTAADTLFPALTLYHGTDENACVAITQSGRAGYSGRLTGIWNVGGGNFAGNGIYFAPARATARHYSGGTIIVCRVTLGRVLDLGMAPEYVYNQCGHPDALGATKWGLDHGYVTGEWWRGDSRWWEYCMYDWQNRYNYSWRIRPLYILNLNEATMQRIPGGMCHWLFRGLVLKDLATSFKELFQ